MSNCARKHGKIDMRALLDTNIVIDIYTNRASGDPLSRKLLMMEKFGDLEFWASASSFTDMFFILNRFFESKRIQEVFEESFRWLQICPLSSEDIKHATNLRWSDFEDCVIDIAAQKVKADYLITRNKKDFGQSSIPVLTPSEFFDMLQDKHGLTYEEVAF